MQAGLDDDGNLRTLSTQGAEAVRVGGEILNQHIRSQTVLKLGLYVLAAVFLVVAALLVVFAPEGREGVTGIIAFALIVVAAGSAGFGTFYFRTSGLEGGAGRGDAGNDPGR